MGYTTVPDRAVNYALVEADWDASIKDNLNTAAWVCLAETILTVATASIDFQSISSSFAHLKLLFYGQSTAGSSLLMRFNNDSAGNYDVQGVGGSATFVGSPAADTFETFATTSAPPGFISSTSSANMFCGYEIFIPHYTNSANNKCMFSEYAAKFGTGSQQLNVGVRSGYWRSNSAINRITLLASSGNLAAGSFATLMAMP